MGYVSPKPEISSSSSAVSKNWLYENKNNVRMSITTPKNSRINA